MRLVTVSAVVKKAIIYLIAFIFIYTIGLLSLPKIKEAILVIFPPKNPPNPKYGKLVQLDFKTVDTLTKKPNYELNTKTGKLPGNFPDRMTIYKFKPTPFSYNAGKDAQEHAAILGFTDDDNTSGFQTDVYEWRHHEYSNELKIDIGNRKLSLNTYLAGKSDYFPKASITKKIAISKATELLTNIGRFTDEQYKKGTQVAYLGKFDGRNVVETELHSEAQIARVDFFRNAGEYKIMPPNPKIGLIHMFVAIPKEEASPLRFPKIESAIWEIDPISDATYPIKTVAEAWKELLNGEAYITNVTPKDKSPFDEYNPVAIDKVLINDIYLAYYDSDNLQEYMQPIYVFEGNYTPQRGASGDITLYVQAIHPDYIQALEDTP